MSKRANGDVVAVLRESAQRVSLRVANPDRARVYH
jgi:hypothetical protein